ncbi:MAG: HEAT repeat domain-containing protein [Planctomycetota bacterium]|jgi:HEAT repeat protein
MRAKGPALLLMLTLHASAPAEDADLTGLLASSLPKKREQGAALLGKQGDMSAAKQLTRLLEDRDWGVRMAALRALVPIRYRPGRDAVVKQALDGEIRAIRILAAKLLREHDAESAAFRIGKRTAKRKKEARLSGLEALGIIGTPAGIEALSKQMRASEPLHRAAAARALGRLRAGEKALRRGLKDREAEVRILAVAALAGIDSDSARAAVLDYAEKPRDPDDSYDLRRIGRAAAAANRDAFTAALNARLAKAKKPAPLLRLAWFGRLSGCAAAARHHFRHRDAETRAHAFRVAGLGAEPLADADVARGLGHKDRRVRYAAATAHIAAAGERRIEVLRQLLTDKRPDVAIVAVREAVEGRVRDVLPELSALAAGKTGAKKGWQARVAACVGLGRVGYDRDLSGLLAFAKSREWWLRAASMEGLYHAYRKEAIPILIAAYDDKHPVVRMTARRNLRYITGKRLSNRKKYGEWWEQRKDQLELKHPEHKLKELDKYGYDTRKFLQDVLRGTDIVAIKGRWDKVEKILEDLQVKHMAIRAQQIKDYGISPKQVVLVNCEGSVDSQTTRYLQWMVVAGGYMATTDWSLVNATKKTFPSVVGSYVKQSTGNDVVVVYPAEPDHPILKGVFRDDVDLMWWLEIQAFPISIEDPIRATVLVDSLQMLTRYGSSAMMVEFPAGLGKVLHSTSHFYLQKEGFAHASGALKRKIFAADHLGLSIEEIRELDRKHAFDNMNNTTPISRSYSMFHLLVNFIDEKRRKDLKR